MIPLVRDGGLYASRKWTPLVMDGGYTQGGGGEPEPAWEYKYVAGMSPLLLAAALGKPLKSLKQYGLCSQADTPAPSAPQDILCNNGALRMVDDELPAGYKRLTGIRFDGDTWYETGEALTGADDVTMTLDNTAGQGQNVFGSYNGTASGSKNFSLFIYGNGVTSNSYFRYGEQLLRPRYGTGERTITFGKSGTDGFLTDVSATPDTFTTPANAYIGMLPNSTSPAYTGDILGNILAGTRLKWIPCERESDNAIGYYEAINGKFLAPVGTGTPTSLGYDGTHYHLAVVGTDEVLSVTASGAATQTASVVDIFAVGDYADEVEIISGGVKRKVGIYVCDGTESVFASGAGWAFAIADKVKSKVAVLCTHYPYSSATMANAPDKSVLTFSSQNVGIKDSTFASKTDVTDFFAAQYAAGTPVIVIYPLADETTESVTPQALSTTEGDNVVSVAANVSPIQLSAEYAILSEAG